jgi:hypothetical protein
MDSGATADVELRPGNKPWKIIRLQKEAAAHYTARVPADLLTPGVLNYRIIIRKSDTVYTYPGAHTGDPYAWDYPHNDSYETFVVPGHAALSLFQATQDRTKVQFYNPDWQSNTIQYTTTTKPGLLALKLTATKRGKLVLGFQCYVADKIKNRIAGSDVFDKLVVRAAGTTPQHVRITLITTNGTAFTQSIRVGTALQEHSVALAGFKKDQLLLLPRPYPGFMPLYFVSGSTEALSVDKLDKLQVLFEQAETSDTPASINIESVWLEQKGR